MYAFSTGKCKRGLLNLLIEESRMGNEASMGEKKLLLLDVFIALGLF